MYVYVYTVPGTLELGLLFFHLKLWDAAPKIYLLVSLGVHTYVLYSSTHTHSDINSASNFKLQTSHSTPTKLKYFLMHREVLSTWYSVPTPLTPFSEPFPEIQGSDLMESNK